MVKVRNPFWDTLKGILIVLVVLGHTGTAIGEKWLSMIYGFHMPLFIFVSGYFSKKKTFTDYFRQGGGGKKLIFIYLAFDFIYLSLDIISGIPLTIHRLLSPSFALWYILALIYWRAILQLIPYKCINNKLFVTLVALLISLLSGFIPLNTEMSFQRACGFLPFFFTGFYMRQLGWIEILRKWEKWPFIILFIGLGLLNYSLLPIFYCNTHYEILSNCGMRALHLGIASLLCAAVLNFTPNKLCIFTNLGKYTLIIYLLHPPLIKLMNIICNSAGIERTPFTAILMTIIAVTFIYSIRNLKILKYLQ